MSRPSDWYPLTDDGRDPVTGDWEMVQEAAARYRRTAEAIDRAKTLLHEVTNTSDGWEGRSGDAFREKATELSDNIFKAYGRYDAAANALAGYWPDLQDAQEESLALRLRALDAQANINAYQGQVDGYEEDDSRTDDEQEQAERARDRAQGQLEAAQGDLASARARLAEVVAAKDSAAQAAANALGDFIEDDGLKDGFWDRVGTVMDTLKDVLILVGEWAAKIAAIAGVLALLVGWIPVIGQALAAILGTIALVATCFSLIGNILKGDWLGAALDIVGIVTFGVGRALTTTLRHAGGAARFQAFRNVRGITGFGNRAARTLRATDIVGDTAGRLHGLNVAANAFTRPSGLLGWGRAAFGSTGTGGSIFGDAVGAFRSLGTANWGAVLPGIKNLPSQLAAAGAGGGFQAGALQAFGMADAAADAMSLGRAAQAGGAASGFGGVSGIAIGGGAAGAASGLGGLIFKDGIGSLGDWPMSLGEENPLVTDVADAGEFTYDPSEAVVQ